MQFHYYHFVINNKFKKMIYVLSLELGMKFESTVGFILKRMFFGLTDFIYQNSEFKKTNYELIDGDSQIHVKLTEKECRTLKNIHAGMIPML